MGELFILNETGEPVEEPNFRKWRLWIAEHDCAVRCSYINGFYISTVFLAANHSEQGEARMLYETKVFGLPDGREDIQQYTTKRQALNGHRQFEMKYKLRLQ